MHYIKFSNEMIHYFICHHKAFRMLAEEERGKKTHTHLHVFETHVKVIWTSYSLSNKIQIKHNKKKLYAITIKARKFLFDLILKWPFSSFFSS